ncbi:MAG: hypothetical protein H7A37_09760 [Chlamydiales bacterium]|nr:hypothetical protein [Chlamydiia bacterium]MCP5508562.1 hypothetical protein [Chlamydiales bacterium]
MKRLFFTLPLLLFTCCGDADHFSTAEKKRPPKGEYLYRLSNEHTFSLQSPIVQQRRQYPWEDGTIGHLSKITKEHFRCNGSRLNPERTITNDGQTTTLYDCGGSERHSLPMVEDKEHIYPILIDLANYIQQETKKKVVITCGHRCPEHNTYADPSKTNRYSKHMIGAEASFYVQGLESDPHAVVQLIIDYYSKHPDYKYDTAYTNFQRYDKDDTNVTTPPWYNKEIFIKLFKNDEGRDFDNRHPFPYISLQVRYDRETQSRVIYSWDKAHRNITRR